MTQYKNNNIVFTNLNAFAGNSIAADLREENEEFRIPGVQGNLVAFYISGRSMQPNINEGDMVICQEINNLPKDLKDGKIYTIISNNGIWVKRIEKIYNDKGKCTELLLISDNYKEYAPFTVELSDIKKIMKVVKRLTGLESL